MIAAEPPAPVALDPATRRAALALHCEPTPDAIAAARRAVEAPRTVASAPTGLLMPRMPRREALPDVDVVDLVSEPRKRGRGRPRKAAAA